MGKWINFPQAKPDCAQSKRANLPKIAWRKPIELWAGGFKIKAVSYKVDGWYGTLSPKGSPILARAPDPPDTPVSR